VLPSANTPVVGDNDDVPQNEELLKLVHDEIRSQGPLTFARYMELALYHPEFGYYRQRKPFGKGGDFYTAEQLQPVFGELMAMFVEQLTERSKAASPFAVLELGSGRGEMAEALGPFGYRPYDWNSSPLPQRWTGLVFANEFFDALPTHLMQKRGNDWVELLIERRGDGLGFTSEPVTQALREYAGRYGGAIPTGGRLEACLEAGEWIDRIAGILSSGYFVLFDYGYESRELVRFPEGTLASYREHRMYADVLTTPGLRDITAHVNFTWVRECAERSGFSCRGSSSLAAWVMRVWGEETLERRWLQADPRWRMQWKQLVFGMGETFRVIEFERS
jgi:SAM-dependent MidA family methyltransferase